ncbi:amino acid/polyamine transporter I [Plectosphaerella plurivora]|uniref:Amino acid/polyamine transporter I n=1 Tax=Plectosphaerella plurivora TaxID=936078 RepID=A0A9P8VN42_9PEZI|nr:amino acid/polyamine transporter I [Plectosphaerella plurivora]
MPLITTTAQILNPGWAPKTWHNFLLYQVVTAMITLTCLKGSRWLERLAYIGGFALFALFFTVIGVVLGGPDELASHEIVWQKIENGTGWPFGLAVLLGASSPLAGYGPTHWMLNMADDVHDPRRTIPLAILAQQVGSVSTLFVLFIALGYGVGADWASIVTTPYRSPIGAIFEICSGSKAAAASLVVLMFVLAILTAASYTSAAARLVYGFAQSKAIPGGHWLAQYNEKDQIPRQIIYVIYGTNVILGFTLLGSSSGLATLVGAATAMFSIGYLPMFVGYVLTRGRYMVKTGWFKLPRWLSLAVATFNIFSVLAQSVVLCLPPVNPITPENMNWASVISGFFLLALAVLYWVYARERYQLTDIILSVDQGGSPDIPDGLPGKTIEASNQEQKVE